MNKIIKARLPKGFRIEIQESESSLPKNVIVLANAKKQRLYVKLCKRADLLKGYIFELLSPNELRKNLHIEESYNGEIYTERGFYIEETLPKTPEEIEEALNKGLKKLKEQGKFQSTGKGQPVNIIIQEKDSEDEKGERPLTKEEKKFLAKEAFKDAIRESREEEALEKAEKEGLDVKIDPVGRSSDSAGQIPLTEAQTGRSESGEYSSYESMIDDLRNRASIGSKDAKIILNELLRKTFQGRKEEPQKLKYEFVGEIDPVTGKETGVFEHMKKQYRRRVLLRREKSNET